MNPVGAYPSSQRRLWRAITATAAILAAFSLLATVWLYTQQEKSRLATIVAACKDTNQRHDDTINALDDLIRKIRPTLTKKQRAQLPVARASDVFLFDHAFPVHKDCGVYADRLLR